MAYRKRTYAPRKTRRTRQVSMLDDPLFMGIVVFMVVLFGLGWEYRFLLILGSFALVGIYVSVVLYRQYLADQRLLLAGITEIDLMSGVDFERRMALHFKMNGYKVQTTPATKDYGADLVLVKDEVGTVAQLKRYSSKLDQDAVRQAVAAKAKYGAVRAMVITNNYFYPAAIELARVNQVELWDRERLIEELYRSATRVGVSAK